jgi:hypothetical protein
MKTKRQVVGWLFVEADRDHVLVREENGHISLQNASEGTFGQFAIQTGAFHRHPILDPVTSEILGYEIESVPLASLA